MLILFLTLALSVGIALLLQSSASASPVYPLKISSDKRHLVDQDGIPFLVNGDAPWSMIVGWTKTETDQYLSDRSSRGFNTVLVNLIDTIVGPSNRYGDQPFTTSGDFSTPNEDYFTHADWVIDKATEYGILVLLAPAYLGYNCGAEGWCNRMKAESGSDLFSYGQFLGNRYKNKSNIIWVHGGDVAANDYGAMDEVNQVANGIASADTVHLMTGHSVRYRSGIDSYNESWLNVNNTYSDCTRTPGHLREDYNVSPTKPFFYIEGEYEDETASDRCLRSQAYWSTLGGAFGHVYGHDLIWEALPGWQAALESPGSRSMTHFEALFRSLSWQLLVPDYNHTIMTSGYGNITDATYGAAARASDGNLVVVYIPSKRNIIINMDQVNDPTAGFWMNPATGVKSVINTVNASGTQTFTPPSNGDWVLVLELEVDDVPPSPPILHEISTGG